MAAWADDLGMEIRLLEHHDSDNGYCPSPPVIAAAIAARTEFVRLRPRADPPVARPGPGRRGLRGGCRLHAVAPSVARTIERVVRVDPGIHEEYQI
jgi:hypothetical protein